MSFELRTANNFNNLINKLCIDLRSVDNKSFAKFSLVIIPDNIDLFEFKLAITKQLGWLANLKFMTVKELARSIYINNNKQKLVSDLQQKWLIWQIINNNPQIITPLIPRHLIPKVDHESDQQTNIQLYLIAQLLNQQLNEFTQLLVNADNKDLHTYWLSNQDLLLKIQSLLQSQKIITNYEVWQSLKSKRYIQLEANFLNNIFFWGLDNFTSYSSLLIQKLIPNYQLKFYYLSPSQLFWIGQADNSTISLVHNLAVKQKKDLSDIVLELKLADDFGNNDSNHIINPSSRLSYLQKSINLLEAPVLNKDQKQALQQCPSLQIMACQNPLQECIILRKEIIKIFKENNDLSANQVLIIANDKTTYWPYLKMILADFKLNFKISYKVKNPEFLKFKANFIKLLDLLNSHFDLQNLWEILEYQPLRAKFYLEVKEIQQLKIFFSKYKSSWGLSNITAINYPEYNQLSQTISSINTELLKGFFRGQNQHYADIDNYQAIYFEESLLFDNIQPILLKFLSLKDCLSKWTKNIAISNKKYTCQEWLHNITNLITECYNLNYNFEDYLIKILSPLSEVITVDDGTTAVDINIIKKILTSTPISTSAFNKTKINNLQITNLEQQHSTNFKFVFWLGAQVDGVTSTNRNNDIDQSFTQNLKAQNSNLTNILLSTNDNFIISYTSNNISNPAIDLTSIGIMIRNWFQEHTDIDLLDSSNLTNLDTTVDSQQNDKIRSAITFTQPSKPLENNSQQNINIKQLHDFWASPINFYLNKHYLKNNNIQEANNKYNIEHLQIDALNESILLRKLLSAIFDGQADIQQLYYKYKYLLPIGKLGETTFHTHYQKALNLHRKIRQTMTHKKWSLRHYLTFNDQKYFLKGSLNNWLIEKNKILSFSWRLKWSDISTNLINLVFCNDQDDLCGWQIITNKKPTSGISKNKDNFWLTESLFSQEDKKWLANYFLQEYIKNQNQIFIFSPNTMLDLICSKQKSSSKLTPEMIRRSIVEKIAAKKQQPQFMDNMDKIEATHLLPLLEDTDNQVRKKIESDICFSQQLAAKIKISVNALENLVGN